MAEALLKHKAGGIYDVYSAGTQPETIDSRAVDAIVTFGLDATGLVSKNVTSFAGKIFDYVITLCDKANNECRSYPNAVKQLAWDFADPKERAGNNPFSTTLAELNNRLSMFLLVEEERPMLREILMLQRLKTLVINSLLLTLFLSIKLSLIIFD